MAARHRRAGPGPRHPDATRAPPAPRTDGCHLSGEPLPGVNCVQVKARHRMSLPRPSGAARVAAKHPTADADGPDRVGASAAALHRKRRGRRRGTRRRRLRRDLGDGEDVPRVEPEQGRPLASDRPGDGSAVPDEQTEHVDAAPSRRSDTSAARRCSTSRRPVAPRAARTSSATAEPPTRSRGPGSGRSASARRRALAARRSASRPPSSIAAARSRWLTDACVHALAPLHHRRARSMAELEDGRSERDDTTAPGTTSSKAHERTGLQLGIRDRPR